MWLKYYMLGTWSASQKFLKVDSRAGTRFSTDKWCLVAVSARILWIYVFLGGACVVLLYIYIYPPPRWNWGSEGAVCSHQVLFQTWQ